MQHYYAFPIQYCHCCAFDLFLSPSIHLQKKRQTIAKQSRHEKRNLFQEFACEKLSPWKGHKLEAFFPRMQFVASIDRFLGAHLFYGLVALKGPSLRLWKIARQSSQRAGVDNPNESFSHWGRYKYIFNTPIWQPETYSPNKSTDWTNDGQ